jgi:Calcineurin-like phosphoesterase.
VIIRKNIYRICLIYILVVCLLLTNFETQQAAATVKSKEYGVLIGDKKGKYKLYNNLVTLSPKGNLMVNAKMVSAKLGLSYSFNNKTKRLKITNKRNGKSIVYTNKQKDFLYYSNKNAKGRKITASYQFYYDVNNKYYVFHIQTLKYLLNYKYFSASDAYYYKALGYTGGVVIYNKYNKINNTKLHIFAQKPTPNPTPTPPPPKVIPTAVPTPTIKPQPTPTPIPAYLTDEINATYNTVLSKQTSTSYNFAFITDMHYYVNDAPVEREIYSCKELFKNIRLNFLALGGDNTSDGIKTNILSANQNLFTALSGLKAYPIKGNHDDNSIYDISYISNPTSVNYLSPSEQYNKLYNNIEGNVVMDDSGKSLYYFHDEKDVKIRFIHLNAVDIPYILDNGKLRYNGQWKYAFSNAQLNWVANKALKFSESGWGVVFIAHIPPIQSLSYVGDLPVENSDVLLGIMQAYKNGTSYTSVPSTGDFAQSVSADYTSQGLGDIIAYLYGHVHEDKHNVVNGITYISTLNASPFQDSVNTPTRTVGTVSETAFDIYTIDRINRKISITRFGAGVDREYTY